MACNKAEETMSRAENLGEMARKAVEDHGRSSYKDLCSLIQELNPDQIQLILQLGYKQDSFNKSLRNPATRIARSWGHRQ
uniref:Uncharacterized protein n=1 Tax=Salix viminalis TaxID=40686 RepID=A0A6N2LJB4_SALVM